MHALSLEGKYLGSLSFPLSKAGYQLKNFCARQKPRVIFIVHNDIVCAVAKICLAHEFNFNEIMNKVFPPHSFPQVLGHENSLIIFKSVDPLSHRIKSMKDALEVGDVNIIKSVLAQLFAIWIYAHANDRNYTHNDLKADNILLTAEKDAVISIGDYDIRSFGVRVMIIDFETATGTLFPRIRVDVSKKMLLDYGLDESLPFSPWTDLHLVCMEVLRHEISGFAEFLSKYYPLDAFVVGNQFVTCHNRLNARGRALMNAHSIEELLKDEYFNS